jgi:hypothetical protein
VPCFVCLPGGSQPESRMREIRTSGSMSGDEGSDESGIV